MTEVFIFASDFGISIDSGRVMVWHSVPVGEFAKSLADRVSHSGHYALIARCDDIVLNNIIHTPAPGVLHGGFSLECKTIIVSADEGRMKVELFDKETGGIVYHYIGH